MTVKLYTNPTLVDILQVCVNMQPSEREQFEASYGEPYDPYRFSAEVALMVGPKWLMCVGDEPIVVGGYQRLRPGVFQDWMVSTPKAWERPIWFGVTRHARRIMDAMLENGAHRLQCISLASRIEAHKWYSVLGFDSGVPLRGYGANGEDMLMFSRVQKP